MTSAEINPLQAFHWSRQPAAESFLRAQLQNFIDQLPYAAHLAQRMQRDTGTRFFDWIDSLHLPFTPALESQLSAIGYTLSGLQGQSQIFRNGQGIFPAVVLSPDRKIRMALKIDSVADFLAINQLDLAVEGEAFAPLRRATIARHNEFRLDIVERRGEPGFIVAPAEPERAALAAAHFEHFRRRNRHFSSDELAFAYTNSIIDAAINDLGIDATCALFFAAEREFWQRRNRAAQIQKSRQDRLGLGWGNHDHHTYRSSRAGFKALIALHEKLGLVCRERFYAGREAGWGAQVMENLSAGVITFNDVDLSPEELVDDFAHNPLPPRDTLGTVGLWCGLHGEALFQAGMHHLECQFDFDALKEQLESEHHINVMKPFTNFPFLRQAFTEGERWPVAEERIEKLLAQKLITPEQAATFRQSGAIGSHLENLERNEGYKGFNQRGVSEIIAATDPRRQHPGT